MRKPTLKRLALGLVQQTAALLLMVAIAAILFNSYLAVDTADGAKVYELSPLDAETEFEDSVIFHDLFQSSVSDIIQLMVIKGQMVRLIPTNILTLRNLSPVKPAVQTAR